LNVLGDFLGDVMVYTTRDENSVHFAARSSVIGTVRNILMRALSDNPFGKEKPYSRVIVMAHSLGSTIALDAIMSVFEHTEEGSLAPTCWNRLRAFVTFGAAIEKTRYFSEASESENEVDLYRRWRDEVYGQLFSSKVDSLRQDSAPIVWSNYWYLQDPVANEINFESFLPPGQNIGVLDSSEKAASSAAGAETASTDEPTAIGRSLCRNVEGKKKVGLLPLRLDIHGDYIADPWFWLGDHANDEMAVLNILDSERLPSPVVLSSSEQPSMSFEIVPRKIAVRYRRYLTPPR